MQYVIKHTNLQITDNQTVNLTEKTEKNDFLSQIIVLCISKLTKNTDKTSGDYNTFRSFRSSAKNMNICKLLPKFDRELNFLNFFSTFHILLKKNIFFYIFGQIIKNLY